MTTGVPARELGNFKECELGTNWNDFYYKRRVFILGIHFSCIRSIAYKQTDKARLNRMHTDFVRCDYEFQCLAP